MMASEKFHQRFEIVVGTDEAKRRFVNRVYNFLTDSILIYRSSKYGADTNDLMRMITNVLGERFEEPIGGYSHRYLDKYLRADFYRSLQALEAVRRAPTIFGIGSSVDDFITGAIQQSEVDLGIQWDGGRFLRTGADLLDQRLVNDPLRWLRDDPSLKAVLQPFERGLSNFVQGEKNQNVLPDVVNAMHESLEALAHIVTGRSGSDLSANRELFLSKINAADAYKKLIKEYIEYANGLVRHAREGRPKPTLSLAEVESFVYLTGLFIRLGIESMHTEKVPSRV